MLALSDVPVVMINQEGIFTYINEEFERAYGWKAQELLGQPVTEIMPGHTRSAHTVGVARFLTTERSELLARPLPLSVLYKDGRVETADHYILGEKEADHSWRFAAIISLTQDNDKARP